MRNAKHIGICFLSACFLLGGCQVLEKKQQAGAAVELNGHYLYRSTLDSLTLGLAVEDSARVAQAFIRQWAQDILLLDEAMARPDDRIEQMAADYRRTLYAQAYETRLVAQRMPKTVADSTVERLYEQMQDRFKLDESIMKGVLVVVPVNAPKKEKLLGWLAKQELDALEKYVYQNARGYELFTDRWMTTTQMIAQMPIERSDIESKLKYTNRIEVTDADKTYILQITDKRMRGEAMPVEFARPEIEKIILNARQVEFLRKERERRYNEAVQGRKVNFF